MTDTEGTEARRSDGEETQFIQPIRDYGRAETKPLDLPRATIGGYRADAVERRVAELERRRTLDQAEIIIAINAADIEKNKIRHDLGIT